MPLTKALFLDRDGVINIDRGYVHKREDWEWREGIFELADSARALGFLLIVITNQSGIARGYYSEEQMQELHRWMAGEFETNGTPLTGIYHCPHLPEISGKCLCRKPGSLLLEKAIYHYGIDPTKSWFVGDSPRDMIAGKKVGCQTLYLGAGRPGKANFAVATLAEAILLIGASPI